jgi:hypothetical protein
VSLRDDVPDPADELVDRWRLKAQEAGVRAAAYLRRVHELEKQLAHFDGYADLEPTIPKWTTRAKVRPGDGITVAMLSDTHWDERVNASEMGGFGGYNRKVAEQRLRTWAEKLATFPQYGPKVNHRGLVLLLGGDLVNGNIHQGRETNDDTLFGTILHWSEQLTAAINLVAEAWPAVHVAATIGNHGRYTAKPISKLAVRDNADHLLVRMVAQHVDKRVTWSVPESTDVVFDVLGRTHLLTHGDRGIGRSAGHGIGGIWPSVMRSVARLGQQYATIGTTVECVWMGHFHQLTYGQGWVINGSTVGYSEYARDLRFRPERPRQAVTVWTERGMDWAGQIVVDD